MDVTEDLVELRAEAESMMTDRCEVSRPGVPTGIPVLDPVTGKYPPQAAVVVYRGICSMKVPSAVSRARERSTAGDAATLLFATLAIPVGSPRLIIGDVALFTASTFNPALVGLKYTVTGLMPGSHPTRQKVSVEAVID